MRIACRTAVFALALSVMSLFGLFAQAKPDASRIISSLSGTWQEDQTKRKLGSTPGLRFRSTASGGLEELRGPETNPMVQSVKLDGKSYDMEGGNSMIWKQIDANTYERKTALNGKPLSVRRIRLSEDGKTLTEDAERLSLHGFSQKRTTEYRRDSGNGKGLVGTWRLVKAHDDVPVDMKYEAAGSNAVNVTSQMGQTHTLFFDGRTSPIKGPNVIPGMVISAKQIDDHTIETTTTREGVTAGTARIALSDGGKVMTVTNRAAGSGSSREPSVMVFTKR